MEKKNYKDILKKYRKEKSKGLKTLGENDILLYRNDSAFNKSQVDFTVKESKSNKTISKIKNQSFRGKIPNIEKNENYYYVFKKSDEDNNHNLPIEMLLLIRKFLTKITVKLLINYSLLFIGSFIDLYNLNNNIF